MNEMKTIHQFLKLLAVFLTVYGLFLCFIWDNKSYGNINQKPRKFNINISLISLSNISNIFMDVNKAAVFYLGDNSLVITYLLLSKVTIRNDFKVKLIVKKDNHVVFKQKLDVLERVICETQNYIFPVIKRDLTKEVCKWNCDENVDIDSTKLTFQLVVNGKASGEFPINIVSVIPKSESKELGLSARLMKCMWMPKNLQSANYTMQLIIESKYSSIYVCVFKKDRKFKEFLRGFNKIKKIHIIELDYIPNFNPSGKAITHYDQILDDPAIVDKDGILDPVMEFLLNQMYPFLIEKYRYVHAADFDFVLYTRNMTFSKRIKQIIGKLNLSPKVSLYFRQQWALPNNFSRGVFNYIEEYFETNSIDINSNKSLPVHLDINHLNFSVVLLKKEHLKYATKIQSYLKNHTGEIFRYVIFKIDHPNIYGQTVHNTESSMIIKLCGAGEFFAGGGKQIKVRSPHIIHYRESYKFDLFKTYNKYVSFEHFQRWADFELFEL